MKKAIVIFNPRAGQGKSFSPFLLKLIGVRHRNFDQRKPGEGYVDIIRESLREGGVEAEIKFTQASGHATQIAYESVQAGHDLIIAVGGDGTINEVINGMVGFNATLGVIPLGTVNIFALQLNLPMDIRQACKVIASGRTCLVDLGKGRDRYFACFAGVGFDAYVIKTADSRLKKFLGALAYVFVAIVQVFRYRFQKIMVRVDDQDKDWSGHFVLISNGKYYAGDRILASKADYTDGLLDICLFKQKNLLSLYAYLLGLFKNEPDKYLKMEYFQCKKISVLREGHHAVHVDAEYLCETPVDFEIAPQALKVAV